MEHSAISVACSQKVVNVHDPTHNCSTSVSSLPCAPILDTIYCSDLNATSWQTEQPCKKAVEQYFGLRGEL